MSEKSKSDLRHEARAKRSAMVVPDFAARLAAHADALDIPAGTLVGAYAALPGEADPHLLVARLAGMGAVILYPRIVGSGLPLAFHRADAGALAAGRFGVPEPADDGAALSPSVLLVPLLAFDPNGHRLGYGGGYYDRTLANFPDARFVGIAYAEQETAPLPREDHDIALHAVLTERGLKVFA